MNPNNAPQEHSVHPAETVLEAPALSERITSYLSMGGLFNPELADHDSVRDLLIDCRAALAAPQAVPLPVAREPLPDEFERGRQQGMQQERALWELACVGQEVEAAFVHPAGQIAEAPTVSGTPVDHSWFSPAALDVTAERRRQIEVEGWSFAHDDEHDAGSIAAAASAYTLAAADELHPMSQGDGDFKSEPPGMWRWDREWWKPSTPRRMLVKAGALILAEIERLDRAAEASPDQCERAATRTA